MEVIAGIILLFVFGIIFAQSGVKMLADAGGWMIGAGLLIVLAIAAGVYIAITKR